MKVSNNMKKLITLGVGVAVGLPGLSYGQIEEIVVTANKRLENFSDVGASISVMSADAIKLRRITSMEDVAAATPGLTYTPSTNNTPIYTLRGIGFNEQSLGVYPAVSVYLDEAPLTFPVLASHAAFDLERIEVLKGPQGTLFGQNSTGGAINYIAAKPTEEFTAGVDVSAGRFNLAEVEGYFSGPLSDTLKARFSYKYHKADAWQTSTERDDENGEEDYFAGRLMLDWTPTERTRVSLNVNGWNDESDPQAKQLSAVRVSVPAFVTPATTDAQFPDREPREAEWTPEFAPESKRELAQGVLRVEQDIGDSLLLTSVTSYIDYDQAATVDNDGTSAVNYDFQQHDASAETLSQELRIENSDSLDYQWVVGVNYENSKVAEDLLLQYDDNTIGQQNNITTSGIDVQNEMKNWAVFANLDYRITDRANFKVGARYTDSEFENRHCGYDAGDGQTAALFNFLGGLASDGNFDPVGPGDCFTLNFEGKPGDVFVGTLEEDNVSWRVGLDYDLSDPTLVYGNVSKGYKQGSFPTLTGSSFVQYEPVTQESVLAYELGIKSRFLDGKLATNAAVFYYDYEDKQIRGRVFDPVFNILEKLRNVPESEAFGAEMDVTYVPTSGLTLSLAATYVETEIKESPVNAINILGQPDDFDGTAMPYTPEWQVSFNGEYTWELDGVSPFVGMTYNYRSETEAVLKGEDLEVPDHPLNRTIAGGRNPFVIDSYGLLALRAGINSADGRWRLFAWGENVTDEYFWSNVVVGEDTIARLAGKPATYGVTFSYDFF